MKDKGGKVPQNGTLVSAINDNLLKGKYFTKLFCDFDTANGTPYANNIYAVLFFHFIICSFWGQS